MKLLNKLLTGVLRFGFTYYKRAKEKKEDDTFLIEKTGGKTKQCYHNDIFRWKRASFSSDVETTIDYHGNRLNNDIKKQNFLKRPNEFNSDK